MTEHQESSQGEEVYRSFLQSLDDDQLVSHIKDLSQSQREGGLGHGDTQGVSRDTLGGGTETVWPAGIAGSFGSTSTDPFDDGLDAELLQMGTTEDTGDEGEVIYSDDGGGGGDGGNGREGRRKPDFENDSLDSSDEEVFDVGKQHGFGDYGTYFQNKKRKQQVADEKFVQWDRQRRKAQFGDSTSGVSEIFKGCTMFVNGHTVPSMTELHKMLILHGGMFISFLSKKSDATHIICDHLTPSKRNEFKNYKVVKAQWVVDSIKANSLLDWKAYRLIEDREYNQASLPFAPLDLKTSTPEPEEEENKRDIEPLIEERELKDSTIGTDLKIMDAKDERFLQHFFANSRLHHLSLWKSELRLKFMRKVLKQKRASQKHDDKKTFNRKVILHIDFDCFFATVSSLRYPHLDLDKQPLAVSHGRGSSDIASCNYVARKFGIRNGMWVNRAKSLCPSLVCMDYDFDAYENISNKFYDYLISKGVFDYIHPVSIDEALVDVSSYFDDEGNSERVMDLCEGLKKDIKNLTGCDVSIGASYNVLLAKLTLRKAKPSGIYSLFDKVEEFLDDIPIRNLPGIGPNIEYKVAQMNTDKDKDSLNLKYLRSFSQQKLQNLFGIKTGLKLYQYPRGIDESTIAIDTDNSKSMLGRKSISVDVNFGIRFDTIEQVDKFLIEIAKELSNRLNKLGFCGSCLSLRVARRSPGAPIDPPKYLGMGACNFFSKSSRLGISTVDWGIIGAEFKALYRMINVPVKELRGVAVTMTKLEDIEDVKKSKQSLLSFPKNRSKATNINTGTDSNMNISTTNNMHTNMNFRQGLGISESDIDWEVFNALPDDIKNELKNEISRRGYRMGSAFQESTSDRLNGSPQKNKSGQKVYLQQLIPTSRMEPTKFVRVVESKSRSPSKSPSKKRTLKVEPKEVSHPQKQARKSEIYEYSSSFDSSVLNELPSSIKNEVLKDLEYNNKVRNFDTETLRERVTRNNVATGDSSATTVSFDWINSKPKNILSPEFLNRRSLYLDMKSNIDGWISMSLEQGGPHNEDVIVFVTYLDSLLHSNHLNRCILLVRYLKESLKCEGIKNEFTKTTSERQVTTREALQDWDHYITNDIVPLIRDYCKSNRIIADI